MGSLPIKGGVLLFFRKGRTSRGIVGKTVESFDITF